MEREPQGISARRLLAIGAFVVTGMTAYFTGQTVERNRHTGCPAEITQEATNPLRIVAVPAADAIAKTLYDEYPRADCETNP